MRMVAEREASAQVFQWVCMACGQAGRDMTVANCPHDGGVLDLRYEPAEIALQPQLPGIWPYAARLAAIDAKHIVSLGEGDTPLLLSSQLETGIGLRRLYFKNEGLNPTGSYKDRIATVGISYLRHLGRRAWAATSSGNAGAALAAYGARRGRRLSIHAGAGAAGEDRADHVL